MKIQVTKDLKELSEPAEKNFLKKKRTMTDPFFIAIFVLIVPVWLYGIISVYPSTSPHVLYSIFDHHNISVRHNKTGTIVGYTKTTIKDMYYIPFAKCLESDGFKTRIESFFDKENVTIRHDKNGTVIGFIKTSVEEWFYFPYGECPGYNGLFNTIISRFFESPLSTMSLVISIPSVTILVFFMLMQYKAYFWLRAFEIFLIYGIVESICSIQDITSQINLSACTVCSNFCIIPDLGRLLICAVMLLLAVIFLNQDRTRKFSRIICCYRYVILHALLLFLAFTVVMLLSLVSLTFVKMNSLFFYIILLGGIYMVNFICYYWKMVSASVGALWKTTKNEEEFTSKTGLECIWFVTRYHCGTIAFAATDILPMCVAITQACKYRFSATQSLSNRVANLFVIFYVTLNSAEYSLIVTTLNGMNFFKATGESIRILSKDSRKSLMIFLERNFVPVIMIFLAPLIILLMDLFVCQKTEETFIQMTIKTLCVFAYVDILLFVPYYSTVFAVTETFHMCELDNAKDNGNEENNGDEKIDVSVDQRAESVLQAVVVVPEPSTDASESDEQKI